MSLGSRAHASAIIAAQLFSLGSSGAALPLNLRRIDGDNANKRLMQSKVSKKKRRR